MRWIKFFFPVKSISPDKADEIMKGSSRKSHILLDVREPSEYAERHIRRAKLIPLREIGLRADELGKDKTILVYCRSGGRSKLASRILAVKGFTDVFNITGGINGWKPED